MRTVFVRATLEHWYSSTLTLVWWRKLKVSTRKEISSSRTSSSSYISCQSADRKKRTGVENKESGACSRCWCGLPFYDRRQTAAMGMASTSSHGIPLRRNWTLRSIRTLVSIHLRKANFHTIYTDATYSLSDAKAGRKHQASPNFSRVVKHAAENYDPSLIANILYQRKPSFSKYYAPRILDVRTQHLALNYSTAVVLKKPASLQCRCTYKENVISYHDGYIKNISYRVRGRN